MSIFLASNYHMTSVLKGVNASRQGGAKTPGNAEASQRRKGLGLLRLLGRGVRL